MVEFLKKLGVPALIAGIIGAMATVIPILFKVDERYAKEQQLTSEIARLENKIDDLNVEVGKLAGSTQVLVAVLSSKQEAPQPIVKAATIDFNKVEPSGAGRVAAGGYDEPHPVAATVSAPEPLPAGAPASAPAPITVGKPIKIAPATQQLLDLSKSLETTQQRLLDIRQLKK